MEARRLQPGVRSDAKPGRGDGLTGFLNQRDRDYCIAVVRLGILDQFK